MAHRSESLLPHPVCAWTMDAGPLVIFVRSRHVPRLTAGVWCCSVRAAVLMRPHATVMLWQSSFAFRRVPRMALLCSLHCCGVHKSPRAQGSDGVWSTGNLVSGRRPLSLSSVALHTIPSNGHLAGSLWEGVQF
eukprot:10800217-Alexandrium_andersonii.AAC.1